MSKPDDGGSAFPESGALTIGDTTYHGHRGMSLRDYAAIKFAAAWVVALGARHNEPGFTDASMLVEANMRGLEQADALIKQRTSPRVG